MQPRSVIIVAEAPWALDPLRGSGLHTVDLSEGVRSFEDKIVEVADFLETDARWCDCGIGVFAYADAVSGALEAAAQRPWGIGALVVVDGIFDAAAVAARVRCPTLFVVSSAVDDLVLPAREACERLGEWGEVVYPESTEEAVTLGRAWFARHLGVAQRDPFAPKSSRPARGAQAMH